jgi:hypothetical protein
MAYEIPPEYEPRGEQIPRWATDVERFRICFAITRLIAQRDDPIFCKQLYDDDRVVTDDVDIAEPGPLPSHPSG